MINFNKIVFIPTHLQRLISLWLTILATFVGISTVIAQPVKAIGLIENSSDKYLWTDDNALNMLQNEYLGNFSTVSNNYILLLSDPNRQEDIILFTMDDTFNKIISDSSDNSSNKKDEILNSHELNISNKSFDRLSSISGDFPPDKTWFKPDFYSIFSFLVLSSLLVFKEQE